MKISTILAVFIIFYSIAFIKPSYSFPEKIEAKLETTVQEIIDSYHLPGVVIGIWVPKKGEWVHAFGLANKATKEKMTLQDHFKIASITKSFIVTAILQLVDKRKISLDDTINKYLPDVPNGDKITIRQLANMTSGLPEYSMNKELVKAYTENKEKIWKPEELLNAAFCMPILFDPGTNHNYCNTNTLLLGLLIEEVSHMSVGEYLEKNIFKPLNLVNTTFPTSNKMPEPYAHGYNADKDMSGLSPSLTFSAGAIVSNLHDLKIWSKALGTGKLLSEKSFKERLTWVDTPRNIEQKKYEKYGLGVGFDRGWFIHTGELPGYTSVIAYLPKREAIVVCLVNSSDHIKTDRTDLSPSIFIFKKIAGILFPNNTPKYLK